MGLFFTLLFVFTAYLGPETVFGSFAEYRIQIVIAVITIGCSATKAAGAGLLRLPQTYAVVGLAVMVFVSILMSGWIGGAPAALLDFLPNSMPFFFVMLNCRKKSHLKMLVIVLAFAALFTTYKAYAATEIMDLESPYLLNMNMEDGSHIIRIKGLSFLGDPNDFAQFIVGLIPCVFFFWKKGKRFNNFLIVYLPVAGLIYGMFLTHSRGAMMALLMVVIVAGRKKLGVVRSVVGAVILFAGLSAVGWSGGREVSASSGEDRMGAWSRGLELIRQYPIWGVGYKRFTEYYFITAHNTVVVCAAELGLIGFFCWVLFVLSTVRDAVVYSGSTTEIKEASDEVSGYVPVNERFMKKKETEPEIVVSEELLAAQAETRRMCGLMVISFAGFLTAGWFLSRSYIMPLFLNAGIVAALSRIRRDEGVAAPDFEVPRAMKIAAMTAVGLITVVYVILRTNNLFGK